MARVSEAASGSAASISPTSAPAQAAHATTTSCDIAHIAAFWKSPRNRREAIQVSLKSYDGHPYLDARVYATDARGRMVPTQRGIAVGVKTLGQFSKAVGDGYRKALQLGLITAGSS
jgi:hypothetical protein